MKRLTVVSYAINGRGMGHLVRQLAILREVRRLCAVLGQRVELWVLTSSEADTLARREGIPALKMPSKAMMRDAGVDPTRYLRVARTWVMNAVAGLAPDLLIADTFPGGSFGELIPALELAGKRALVARAVRPEFEAQAGYQALLPLYDARVVPGEGRDAILLRSREELMGRQAARQALGVPDGKRAVYVTLGGGGDVSAATLLPRLVRPLRAAGWQVVVGAGPLYMGPELRGEGITWMDRYLPMELFGGLDVAVSAGGYNSFHELMHAGVPAVFLPQPRIADDQSRRVQGAVSAGAGLQAASLAEVPALLEQLLASGDAAAAARDLVPVNAARRAAITVLGTLLPQQDLEMAAAVLSPQVVGVLNAAGARHQDQALSLVRLLAGGSPSERVRAQADWQRHQDQGPPTDEAPAAPGQRVGDFLDLCQRHDLPLDMALNLTQALDRKFPAAQGPELLAAARLLFPAWARFDDWMGAVSLMRAVPVQRSLSLGVFAEELAAWLATEEELFDALRRFTRLEGSGQTPVAGVLRQLRQERP